MARRPAGSIPLLLDVLDEAFEKKAWQGPNLRGALRGVSAREAVRRPSPGRHNIWELVVHAAYWKYAVWRLLAGQKRGHFFEEGSNWFARRGRADEKAWKGDVSRLASEHRRLRAAVAALDPSALERRLPGSKYRTATLVYGVAAHDVYHTGQIQLIKSLRRKSYGR